MRNEAVLQPSHFRRKQTLVYSQLPILRRISIQIVEIHKPNDSALKSTTVSATGRTPGNSWLVFLLLYIMFDPKDGHKINLQLVVHVQIV